MRPFTAEIKNNNLIPSNSVIISVVIYIRQKILGAFHLGKKPGNFGGSKSGISDW